MDLRTQIKFGYGLLIAVLASVRALAVLQFGGFAEKLKQLTSQVTAEINLANEIRTEILSMRTAVEKFILREARRTSGKLKFARPWSGELLKDAQTSIHDAHRRELVQVDQLKISNIALTFF